MAIIVILFAVLMSALNTAVTGNGNVKSGTVRGVEDQVKLYGLVTSMMASGSDMRLAWPEPARVRGGPGVPANVTAILYSMLVMQRDATLESLVSSNEYSPNVYPMANYNFAAYDASIGRVYDPAFKADLEQGSNASFAHMPLCGDRKAHWTEARMDASFPLLGTRGPKDGDTSRRSYTFGRDGTWAGFRAFGDGHVAHTTSMFAEGRGLPNGEPDNVFMMETYAEGDDAILAFTKVMTSDGPTLQFD